MRSAGISRLIVRPTRTNDEVRTEPVGPRVVGRLEPDKGEEVRVSDLLERSRDHYGWIYEDKISPGKKRKRAGTHTSHDSNPTNKI